MVTKMGLCHSFSVLLPMMLLLLLTTPKHMTQEGSRMGRSAPSPDVGSPRDAAHTSEPSLSSDTASVTQRPAASADVFVTQGSHASGSKDEATTPAHTQPHDGRAADLKASAQPQTGTPDNSSHRGFPAHPSTSTTPSPTIGHAPTALQPAATSPLPGTAHSSAVAKASSESSRAPDMSEAATPTLPASESSAGSSPPPTPVYTKVSAVTASVSAAGHTTVSSGDPRTMTTLQHVPTTNATTPAGLPPQPHPKVTEVTSTTTTTSRPPLTPRRNECPVFTQSPEQKRTLVSNCLIAIASLAGLATFFMACSIVLCSKLSAARQRYRYHLQSSGGEGTEMVCISALLPDGDGPPIRHKIPKSNGALIPITDTDSDGGDNLTLNSFLPDGDRV